MAVESACMGSPIQALSLVTGFLRQVASLLLGFASCCDELLLWQ